jgi:hypothetical protein
MRKPHQETTFEIWDKSKTFFIFACSYPLFQGLWYLTLVSGVSVAHEMEFAKQMATGLIIIIMIILAS